jgi:hypothetical protein
MEMLAIYKGHTDAEEGVSKSSGNAWRKVTAIFETVEHFPKTIAVTGLNAMCETILQCIPGKLYRVRFDVESRSWTGTDGKEKWFTDCKAWGIALEVPAAAPGVQAQPQSVPATPKQETNGDLPF